MSEPYELTACQALAELRGRRLSSEELIASCLRRIAELEPTLEAWAHLDPPRALERARALDAGAPSGPLHGLPLGVKDVIDTAEFLTEHGCPAVFGGSRPKSDAACVALASRAGAITLGKTVTQAFACGAPVRTANGLDPDRTSGGSSAGSAAAVAAKMIPIAFGTQSASSTIRPASYNGLVGMRPSMGLISTAGMKCLNPSFDTLGLLARDVSDVELLWCTQVGVPFERAGLPARPPRIAVCRAPWTAAADQSARDAVDKAERCFALAGAEIRDLPLPEPFGRLVEAHERIQSYEAARSYAAEYFQHAGALDEQVTALIETGFGIPFEEYLQLQKLAAGARREFGVLVGDADCVLTTAAPGEAPLGARALGPAFKSMGSPNQSRAWTLLHLPAVTVPCHTGPSGMPVGIQLIGGFGADRRVLRVAHWAAAVLSS